MSRLSRRSFIQGTLAAAATVTIAGTKSSGKVLGANDTIRVAIAGLNGRGTAHTGGYLKIPGVEIVYLADPDTRTYAKHLKAIGDKGKPQTVQDVRKALEDKNVDAVSIATPNHWHALMTIWSCQAGKDVYVEKPCSHNIHEGRIAVDMARKHNRIVQHGTQSRTEGPWAQIVEVIKSGKYGKLLVARGLCYKDGGTGGSTRGSIGFAEHKMPPKELDFNIWLGPAKEQPYHENIVHYRWHWFWDFGNGDMGNQGVHEMDKARWAVTAVTGKPLPKSAIAVGLRPFTDQGQTACYQVAVYDYGETKLIFETRGLKSTVYPGSSKTGVDNVFHLEAGTIVGGQFIPKGKTEAEPLPKVDGKRGPGSGPFGNFIAAVKSRKVADLNADIEEGHYSSALCHLGNMSYRLAEQVPFSPRTTALNGDKDADDALARMEEHLATECKIKLSEHKLRVGRRLMVDPKTEKIVGDSEANKLWTREYRKGFEVPEKV